MAEKIKDFDYPKWKYHASKTACIVQSEKEEKALGNGWENSPAYFDKKECPVIKETQSKKKKKARRK